jgi:hypothetical protein
MKLPGQDRREFGDKRGGRPIVRKSTHCLCDKRWALRLKCDPDQHAEPPGGVYRGGNPPCAENAPSPLGVENLHESKGQVGDLNAVEPGQARGGDPELLLLQREDCVVGG